MDDFDKIKCKFTYLITNFVYYPTQINCYAPPSSLLKDCLWSPSDIYPQKQFNKQQSTIILVKKYHERAFFVIEELIRRYHEAIGGVTQKWYLSFSSSRDCMSCIFFYILTNEQPESASKFAERVMDFYKYIPVLSRLKPNEVGVYIQDQTDLDINAQNNTTSIREMFSCTKHLY